MPDDAEYHIDDDATPRDDDCVGDDASDDVMVMGMGERGMAV